MTSSLITPSDLGLPPKFQSWRTGQWECIETATLTDKRFIGLALSTGAGKSLSAVTTALMTGGRCLYLTASKSLQDQLVDDGFEGLSDMRGRQNFECIKSSDAGHRLTCNEGRILECRTTGCSYQASRQEFLQSKLALTNYAYALSSTIRSEGVGTVDVLVCDEAHQVDREISNAIEIHLDHKRNNFIYNTLGSFPPHGKELALWRTWAKFLLPKAQSYLKSIKESNNHRNLASVDSLVFSLESASHVPESWILDQSNGNETVISPLWPTEHTEKYLFRGIKKIILPSATLVPKTFSILNIPEQDALFLSQDHTFDPTRCPVWLFGPCRVDHRMSDGQWQEVIGRMDTLIERRLDRKGLIHPVSYSRQQDILRMTRHRSIMIAPSHAGELREAIAEFKRTLAPAILISPAITTGYDFPLTDAEYQLIIKVPFIDARSPVMKARSEADPEYLNYLTAQTLTQTCGRIMRSPEDMGETIILDAHANWFTKKHRDLFPSWFLRQVRYANGLPVPPPPLSLAA